MDELRTLAVTAEAAERCASICADFSNELSDVYKFIQSTGHAGGFGTLPSGIALQKKYSDLAVGGPGSLSAMLQAHIAVATNLAATFTEIGRNYVATDDAVAQAITAPR